MTKMNTFAWVCAALICVPSLASAETQPHMKAALAALQAAKANLQKASHDKGGHRIKALAATGKAIGQVRKGIKFDNRNGDIQPLPTIFVTGLTMEKQPRMKAALASLIVAKNQLKKSSHDKGGHRVKALAATNIAIAQVQKGIGFDNQRKRR
ncbi:MAG: hypothetical protein ACI9OJ_003702 [Myxococcota bacterium]|jgi:hypothetical protein